VELTLFSNITGYDYFGKVDEVTVWDKTLGREVLKIFGYLF